MRWAVSCVGEYAQEIIPHEIKTPRRFSGTHDWQHSSILFCICEWLGTVWDSGAQCNDTRSPLLGHWFSGPAVLKVWPKVQPNSGGSDLSLSACLIQQLKGGADHLGFINTQMAKSLVVPIWGPPPVTRTAKNTRYDLSGDSSLWVWEHLKSAHTWGPLWRCVWAWSSQSRRAPGGTGTPAPPPSLLPCVGCHRVQQTRTPARRSLYTGLSAMIWGGGGRRKKRKAGQPVRHVGMWDEACN